MPGAIRHARRLKPGLGHGLLVADLHRLGPSLVAAAHRNLSEPEPAFGLLPVHLRHDDSVRSDATPDHQADRAAPVRDPQRLSNHDERGFAEVRAGSRRLCVLRFLSGIQGMRPRRCRRVFATVPSPGSYLRMRGVSSKFMVLEQQSGPSGQIGGVLNGNPDYLHPTPKPGQMRLWCWNSIANGADGLLFFRWRSLPYGSEAHWNGLLYHDERNAWRLEEAKQLGEEIKRVSATLTGTRLRFEAAILYDFDNESHARIERVTGKHREANELERVPSLVRATFVRRRAAPVERSGGRRLGRLPNRLFSARARVDGRRHTDFAGLRGRRRHAGFRLLERLSGPKPLVL